MMTAGTDPSPAMPRTTRRQPLQHGPAVAGVGDRIAIGWKDNRGESRTDEATVT
jgi:hypothetical protein